MLVSKRPTTSETYNLTVHLMQNLWSYQSFATIIALASMPYIVDLDAYELYMLSTTL